MLWQVSSLESCQSFSCIPRYSELSEKIIVNYLIELLLQPNPKKLPKMDSVAYETFGTDSIDETGDKMDKMKLDSVDE